MPENNIYNEEYFEDGIANGVSLYENYRWIPELTIPMAYDMILELGIKRNDKVLDFGCAKGYLVRAFRLLGHKAFGVDISQYAIDSCPHEVAPYVSTIENMKMEECVFDFTIAKDVFEHVPHDELDRTIDWVMKRSKRLFVAVPLGNGIVYEIPAMDRDKTHIIRESMDWWIETFDRLGYNVSFASHKMGTIKNKWVERYPEGNGFFIITNRN